MNIDIAEEHCGFAEVGKKTHIQCNIYVENYVRMISRRTILQRYLEVNKDVYMCLLFDYTNAFERVRDEYMI